jgi:hypothetical protein
MSSTHYCQARVSTLLTVTMIGMNLFKLIIQAVPPFLPLLELFDQEGHPQAALVLP